MDKKIWYFELSDLIDQYIEQEGITTAAGQIITIIGNRLSTKALLIKPQLKAGDVDAQEVCSLSKEGGEK